MKPMLPFRIASYSSLGRIYKHDVINGSKNLIISKTVGLQNIRDTQTLNSIEINLETNNIETLYIIVILTLINYVEDYVEGS